MVIACSGVLGSDCYVMFHFLEEFPVKVKSHTCGFLVRIVVQLFRHKFNLFIMIQYSYCSEVCISHCKK